MDDKTVILTAVADLLEGPVRAEVKDPAVAFRVRLAAGLLRGVVHELEAGEATGEPASLREALARRLGVVAPHFDTSLEIER